MNSLFQNAVYSIQLGVDDYYSNDHRRAISAIRNFSAGVLLLAKEVLVRKVPNSDPMDVLAANHVPILGEAGELVFIPKNTKTIDLHDIIKRFQDFSIPFNPEAFRKLATIRNDIEHFCTDMSSEAVLDTIATAFPAVADLFRLLDEEPRKVLGDTWLRMLEVSELYERERADCKDSFRNIIWTYPFENHSSFCTKCHSYLVRQKDEKNINFQKIKATCLRCGSKLKIKEWVQLELREIFPYTPLYPFFYPDGDPISRCPSCNLNSYIKTKSMDGCAWCAHQKSE